MERQNEEVNKLEDLLEQIEQAAHGRQRLSLRMIFETLGDRSFAPLLLPAGLVAMAPGIGEIPAVPILMGGMVLLVAGQMLFPRKHIWLPAVLLDRSVDHEKLDKALRKSRRPARWIDRLLRPRMTVLATHIGAKVIALTC